MKCPKANPNLNYNIKHEEIMRAQGIQYDGKDYCYYLKKQVGSVFRFKNVDKETVKKTIENFPTKINRGCDGISSKLLKIIESVITKSLTLLINHVIYSFISFLLT